MSATELLSQIKQYLKYQEVVYGPWVLRAPENGFSEMPFPEKGVVNEEKQIPNNLPSKAIPEIHVPDTPWKKIENLIPPTHRLSKINTIADWQHFASSHEIKRISAQVGHSVPVMLIEDDDEERTPASDALLWKMLAAIALEPEQVYRTVLRKSGEGQTADKLMLCKEIGLYQPLVLICMGNRIAQMLTGQKQAEQAELRGKWFDFMGIPLRVIFSASHLLVQPAKKRSTWEDLQTIQKKLTSKGGLQL
ncbi:MAG: hypothetical protein J0L94_04600 [Rhodothermia bacterium]|nr:hypothetical protein [Rhodothermia bacterium]